MSNCDHLQLQYLTLRRDAIKQGETGLAIYIHSSIQSITTRRADLEWQSVESLFVEIRLPPRHGMMNS